MPGKNMDSKGKIYVSQTSNSLEPSCFMPEELTAYLLGKAHVTKEQKNGLNM